MGKGLVLSYHLNGPDDTEGKTAFDRYVGVPG